MTVDLALFSLMFGFRRNERGPLTRLESGAKKIDQFLVGELKTEKGVHAESFLSAIGALAGFSCQISIRSNTSTTPPTGWAVVVGADGKKYYFGETLNQPLIENPAAVWRLVSAAAQDSVAAIPDISKICEHVAATVGGPEFGVPRIPPGHRPAQLPVQYVRSFWPKIYPIIVQLCGRPDEWPVLLGLSAQQAILMVKGGLSPHLGVTIVMESAVPMSKVDLPEFYSDAG